MQKEDIASELFALNKNGTQRRKSTLTRFPPAKMPYAESVARVHPSHLRPALPGNKCKRVPLTYQWTV